MSPLVESPLVACALIVGVIVIACGLARLIEYWEWFRERPYYEDDPLPPPNVRSQRYDPSAMSRGHLE